MLLTGVRGKTGAHSVAAKPAMMPNSSNRDLNLELHGWDVRGRLAVISQESGPPGPTC
ncbi:hypothetical protein [Micromonospora sp. NPDC005205]|uniref:hypothetical protein n=1 Tax=Micromonospora sp. NPDC005205 TaxID=3156714 RepID=UPI0033BE610C